jgi:hypothetical protein
VNPRLEYALAHPLNGVGDDITRYRTVEEQRDGTLLVVILAVDR